VGKTININLATFLNILITISLFLKINAKIDKNKRGNSVVGLNILSKTFICKVSEEILTTHP
jgi:hypothetical protein